MSQPEFSYTSDFQDMETCNSYWEQYLGAIEISDCGYLICSRKSMRWQVRKVDSKMYSLSGLILRPDLPLFLDEFIYPAPHQYNYNPPFIEDLVEKFGRSQTPTLALIKTETIQNLDVKVRINRLAPSILLVSCQDVSIQRTTETALLDSLTRFRRLLEQAPWGISIFSNEGSLLFTNLLLHPPPGIDPPIQEKLLDKYNIFNDPSFMTPGIKPLVKKAFHGFPIHLPVLEYTAAYHRIVPELEDRKYWLDCSFFPTRDSGTGTTEIILFHRDVSRRHQIENQLRQAEKMESIGQLAGGIAHDFNNQLTGIQGYAELILQKVDKNTPIKRYLDNMMISIQHASNLTHQLLTFARKGSLEMQPTDIHQTISEVSTLCTHTFPNNIQINQCLSSPQSTILVDPSALQNALLNLAVNARDAMPEGGTLNFSTSMVSIRASQLSLVATTPPLKKPGKYLVIQVSDTGQGMPPEIRNRIFEPFFTTKEKGKGTGMGLAAVYGILDTHSGGVAVQTSLGKGTEFHLFFPLNYTRKQSASISPTRILPHIKNVLIVDDDILICKLIASMLELAGLSSRIFTESIKALEYYKHHYTMYDLIILDVIMPNLDGKQLLSQMQMLNPHLHAILISGFIPEPSYMESLKPTQVQFLHKPFDFFQFSKILNTFH